MASRKNLSLFHKIFSLFSVLRIYNILVLIAAQYLAAIFIFSLERDVKRVLFDLHLFFIVFATVTVVAGGYIINNFYDVKADAINRPFKTNVDSWVSQQTKLRLYFLLNFMGTSVALFVSWRAALFFSIYIFGIWFYSHKLKKYPLLGLLSVTILTILPFFAVFVYFKNFSTIIFVHAFFLYLMIVVRELIKDLENLKGAVVNNYTTFPVAFGEKKTKQTFIFLLAISLIPIIILLNSARISYMKYYLYFALVSLIVIGFVLGKSKTTQHYTIIHTALKLLLVFGVLSLVFIDPNLLLDKVIRQLN